MLPPRDRAGEEVVALLSTPDLGLIRQQNFPTSPYRPKLGLDYIAPPTFGAGVSQYGTLVSGGTALYFSDMLNYHTLMLATQTDTTGGIGHFYNNLAGIVQYVNQRSRWDWGFIGGQIPFLTGGYGEAIGVVKGQPVDVQQEVAFWQINRQIAGIAAYPFNVVGAPSHISP